MKMKKLIILALSAGIGLNAGKECAKYIKSEDVKKGVLSKGSGQLTLGGTLKEEYTYSKNPVFLNSDLPDSYSYSKTTVELEGDYRWGKEKYGHDAIIAHSKLRHKGYWGDAESSVKTDSNTVSVSDTTLGEHYHASTKPFVWFKELWLSTSVDALCNVRNVGTHTLKAGYFPFKFGRGISLGEGYGTPKEFLGVYNRKNDYHAPGVLYSGDVYDGKVGYDFYYAKFEDNSTSPKQTLEQTKAHRLDLTEDKSWRGSGNDDELWGVQLRLSPSEGGVLGKAIVSPYLFVNIARDKKIEMVADSRSDLITLGCAIEYECNGFECGGEVAFNRGKEHVYGIDRNTTAILKDSDTGVLTEYYTHILTSAGGSMAPAVLDLKTELQSDLHRDETSFTAGSTTYYNASNRTRDSYNNKYRGWMGVWDIAYTLQRPQLKMAACCGWVTGDSNPNATETDKEYRGFVGLNELYKGKRVTSVFVLDGRTLKRPLTFSEYDNKMQFAGEDGSFTDLRFVGYSMSYVIEKFKHKNPLIQTNSILFWKDYEQFKAVNGTVSETEKASRFLGAEFNVIAKVDPLENMTVSACGGVFLPGGYYKDIKGTQVRADQFTDLDVADTQNVDSTTYRIGNDVAYFFKMAVEYRF
ncbi:hypothetical protein ACFLY6_01760 [Candidatus Dependentiae bacterium]